MASWEMVSLFRLTAEAGNQEDIREKIERLRSVVGSDGKVVFGGNQFVVTLVLDVPGEELARSRGYELLHRVTDEAGLRIMFEAHHDGSPEFHEK